MSNDPRQLERIVIKLKDEIEREVSDRLPRKVGALAVQHFKQNFRESGFRDDGLSIWKKSHRELSAGNNSKYKTLTSARNHLMNSTEAHIGRGEVSIENPVPYASIHNEGGILESNPTITPQMRKFAWAMVYKLSGRTKGRKRGKGSQSSLPQEAEKWKALALTKKTKLHIKVKMPKRKFIGESAELSKKINKEIEQSIERIKDGISSL